MLPQIVQVVEGVPTVSHRVVAENIGVEQRAIVQLIQTHKTYFERFGVLTFEMEGDSERKLNNPDSKPQKTYYLNEPQAMFLMTLSKNSPQVVEFKFTLVKAFDELRTPSAPTLSPTMEDLLLRQNALLSEVVQELRVTQQAVIDAKDETIQIQREAMEMLANVAPKNVTINNSVKTNTRYSLRMGNTSGEELFINAVKMILMREHDGITQGELLTSLGKSKADKTALRWLHTNVGIHWDMIPVGRHNFFVIANAMRGVA